MKYSNCSDACGVTKAGRLGIRPFNCSLRIFWAPLLRSPGRGTVGVDGGGWVRVSAKIGRALKFGISCCLCVRSPCEQLYDNERHTVHRGPLLLSQTVYPLTGFIPRAFSKAISIWAKLCSALMPSTCHQPQCIKMQPRYDNTICDMVGSKKKTTTAWRAPPRTLKITERHIWTFP